MCSWCASFAIPVLYFLAINFVGVFFHLVIFHDYFECFLCQEMNTRTDAYDYIVVGSGSAGSIVAQRLSEDRNTKVLLIEAGSSVNRVFDEFFDIPSMGPLLQNSDFDWRYRTVPQKYACWALQDKVSYWPMGKVVGGTSRLNNMVYIRGHPDDFSAWYQNKSDFDYDLDILPFFKKVEGFTYDKSKPSVIVSDVPFLSDTANNFLKVAQLSNCSVIQGLESEPGFRFPKATMLNGGRYTSWHRLMHFKKSNLQIIPNSVVEKVLFKDNFEAYGVRYMHLNKFHEVKATKGVILSAGVIGSPKILMLSGIGPSKHLKSVKIKPILNLPVGDNLQDHVTTGLDLLLLDSRPNLGIFSILSPLSALSYFIRSKGPWTSTGCEGLAFFRLGYQKTPDLQFMILPLGVTSDNGAHLRSLVGITDELWDNYFSKIKNPAITILPIVLHPKSRGTVRLRNNDVNSAPLINPNYLSEKEDVELLIKGIEKIKQWIDTEPLQELGARLNNITFPGCEKYQFDTKPYWECYVRHLTITSYHPVGTCKLGTVIDYDFRVIGTNKLYVVDGSVLPELPSGNPNAAIMMMAEKAVGRIKYHRSLEEDTTQTKDVIVDKINC